MIERLKKLSSIAALALISACETKVPDADTSLARDPGPDPGKPSKPLSMVWLHHSTGDCLLKGGLRAALDANGVKSYDINYKEADVNGYVIGDHTDTADWPRVFNTAGHMDLISRWELGEGTRAKHNIVMFKSCYPNSAIKSEQMLGEYRQAYTAVLPTFQANPNTLFIGMSTPPLVKAATTPDEGRRARAWAKWLTTEYARNIKNVRIFDLFDALAVSEGKPLENTLAPQFARNRNDSHPNDAGARAMTRMFMPWFNRTIREAGFAE